MSSDNESPAVVELPDDAIKALVEAASGIDIMPELLARVPEAVEYVNAWRKTLIDNGSLREESPTNEFLGVVTIAATWAVNGVIAARVRAEALREAAEKIAPNQVRPSNVIIVGARMSEDVLSMVRTVEDALVAAVRAEAVAAERQRIKATVWTQRGLLADREHTLAVVNRIIDAAGSVPVATRLQPERVGFGTDAFEVGGSLPGQPVATPTTPGRVTCRHCGYFVDSDAHERTCGRVATPTEPDGAALITTERRRQVEVEGWTHEHDGRHRRESLALAAAAYVTPQDKRAYREVGECIVPAWWPWAPEWWKPTPSDRVRELVKAGALIAAEIDRLRAASPVPAEQPEER